MPAFTYVAPENTSATSHVPASVRYAQTAPNGTAFVHTPDSAGFAHRAWQEAVRTPRRRRRKYTSHAVGDVDSGQEWRPGLYNDGNGNGNGNRNDDDCIDIDDDAYDDNDPDRTSHAETKGRSMLKTGASPTPSTKSKTGTSTKAKLKAKVKAKTKVKAKAKAKAQAKIVAVTNGVTEIGNAVFVIPKTVVWVGLGLLILAVSITVLVLLARCQANTARSAVLSTELLLLLRQAVSDRRPVQ